jgi:hypothetical protein
MPDQWVLSGPQTGPTCSWCPTQTHGMMVLFLPNALHLMTRLAPAHLTDRMVDAFAVLPADWLRMCQQVQEAPEDGQRMQRVENFLEPRGLAQPWRTQRFNDGLTHLAHRAAVSASGRSLRELERRVKHWAGLPLRELRGMGRAGLS